MPFLPTPPIVTRLPMPVSGIRNTVVSAPPVADKPRMVSLPMPVFPLDMPKEPAKRAAVIEQVKEAAAQKRGRASKADLKKAEKAAQSERVRAFLESKPDKKSVIEYLKNRVVELSG